ncbi:hypothetical protein SAMN05660297_00859 [Natronincola peptidivorans]|uniref:Lipoprotein n=1 Tax=Natronincola peptidivorans TaxID=426128 RepID=A0A1I0A392_9FIRM|nr:hypothetical protein [Natronincola peptidivorans]SES88608.1 hypothetical protein SAMN05660297_00859 [Natronincola peptidivorans]
MIRRTTIILICFLFNFSFISCTQQEDLFAEENKLEEGIEVQHTNNYTSCEAEAAMQLNNIEAELISAIPNRHIYLYGGLNKVMLDYEGEKFYYDWSWSTPRNIQPRMYLEDFSNDGNNELAVILHVGSGTGVSIDELHIIEVSQEEYLSEDQTHKEYMVKNPEYFKAYCYKDYTDQLQREVKMNIKEKPNSTVATIEVNGEKHTINIQKENKNTLEREIGLGQTIRFDYEEGSLLAAFGIAIFYPHPDYIGEIAAEVNYEAGRFQLNHMKFVEYRDE